MKIKSIPTLIGKDAEIFIKKADFTKALTIDFTKQIEISRQIIEKAVKKNETMRMTQKEMRDTVIDI